MRIMLRCKEEPKDQKHNFAVIGALVLQTQINGFKSASTRLVRSRLLLSKDGSRHSSFFTQLMASHGSATTTIEFTVQGKILMQLLK